MQTRIKNFRNLFLYGFLFLLISIAEEVPAASKPSLLNDLQGSIQGHFGMILPHESSIRNALVQNIGGFECNLFTKSYGRSAWDSLYRFPEYGIGYVFSTLGNPDVFGNAHSIFLFLRIDLGNNFRKLGMNYELGLGPAILTRAFDSIDNPMNKAISAKLNLFARLKFNVRYRLNEKNKISLGLSFAHYSNGKVKTPNLGLNAAYFSLAYSYVLRPERYLQEHEQPFSSLKKHRFEFYVNTGWKSDDQASDEIYWIASVVGEYSYTPWKKYAVGCGTDLFYDPSLGPNKLADWGEPYDRSELFQAGIHGSLYARYGRLYLVGQLGVYFYAKYYKYTPFYSRIGLRYELTDRIKINLTLKSHRTIADFMEWGIGYVFGS